MPVFKFSPSTVVKEKKSGTFFRVVQSELKPIQIQGCRTIVDHKSYIITPLLGRKTMWSVNEEDLEIPTDFPCQSYVSPGKVRKIKPKKTKAPKKPEMTRWEALQLACQQAISHF